MTGRAAAVALVLWGLTACGGTPAPSPDTIAPGDGTSATGPAPSATPDAAGHEPLPRAAAAAVVVGDRVLVVGGGADGGRATGALESYDPRTDAWSH